MRKVGGVDDAIWTLPPEDRGREGRPNTGQWAVVIVLAAVIALGVVYPAMAAVLSRKDYGTFGFWKVPNRIDYCGRRYYDNGPQPGSPVLFESQDSAKGARWSFCRGLSADARSTRTWLHRVHRTQCARWRSISRLVTAGGRPTSSAADHDSNPGVRDRRPARVSRHSSRTGDPLVTASVTIPNARSSGASASASSCPEAVIPRARSTRSGLHRSYSSTRSPRGLRPMRSRIGSSDAKALWARERAFDPRPTISEFVVILGKVLNKPPHWVGPSETHKGDVRHGRCRRAQEARLEGRVKRQSAVLVD